jgi:hypothetical protein
MRVAVGMDRKVETPDGCMFSEPSLMGDYVRRSGMMLLIGYEPVNVGL